MDDLPEDEEREFLVRCLLLTSHSSSLGYSTMRGYQYPLTDTDVGQFATNDREHFHHECRIIVN